MNNNILEKVNEAIVNPTANSKNSNNKVIMIQSLLKNLNYYDASVTGSFDNYTKNKINNFQKRYNLKNKEFMNDETWEQLYRLTNNKSQVNINYQTRPTLKLGSSGQYVIELQNLLTNLLYYHGSINGIFDTATELAVKTFQTNNKLTPDGIVGRDTWSALSTLYSPLAICEEDGSGYITYTVVAGDSLWSIAQKFNTTVDAIKKLNNLTSDMILTGQQLLIPNSNGSITPPDNITYTVIAGDSLWRIAQKFNTTVDAIKELNNLTSNNLSIGQQLLIPTNNQKTTTYTVVAGDSLWRIAQRFNTTVDAIKKLNNLTSNNLNIGQQLLIPLKS